MYECSETAVYNLLNGSTYIQIDLSPYDVAHITVDHLNQLRDEYIKTKDKSVWIQMIQLLPSSYNQKRTWSMNYEVLYNIYQARKEHKLDEWRKFCQTIVREIPYFAEIFEIEEKDVKN